MSRMSRPDLSFPGITTDTARGGFSEEYRLKTGEGYIRGDAPAELGGLRRSISRVPTERAKFVGDDPEKARRLKEVKLVTWKADDKEDPRSWSSLWRWGEFVMNTRLRTGTVADNLWINISDHRDRRH
jgi:hypothetical protein